MQRTRTSEKSVKRVILVDDHPIMRHGLAQLIRAEDGLDVIGEAGNAREGLEVVGKLKPDLAVIDLTLPDKNGLELVKDIRAMHAATQCLVLSMHDETMYGERALRAGARGYVMKEEAADQLVTAIHKVLGGGLYVSESLNARMLEQVTGAARSKATGMDSLTDRELEILTMIGKGVATKLIAAQLSISARTVEAHRAHIKEKLSMTDGAALVRYAVQWVESQAKL
ncbi:response regulator [Prosthecobacter vanneervenii]|uniref:DNA-binding NarL/FixJ family response regulator n=1 Tax=Prosthecobacter vanneervenii TaxID=48466 RepID=A0A7W7YF78_9BACT|nr:response regulator transcription factor [Prosthecobacter vanneervenii]MBB5035068.1 DNA-binding NarL/FixJ family response regulator [Prosthecobacter vanneervenii]